MNKFDGKKRNSKQTQTENFINDASLSGEETGEAKKTSNQKKENASRKPIYTKMRPEYKKGIEIMAWAKGLNNYNIIELAVDLYLSTNKEEYEQAKKKYPK
jgi:hypothetical protein